MCKRPVFRNRSWISRTGMWSFALRSDLAAARGEYIVAKHKRELLGHPICRTISRNTNLDLLLLPTSTFPVLRKSQASHRSDKVTHLLSFLLPKAPHLLPLPPLVPHSCFTQNQHISSNSLPPMGLAPRRQISNFER